MTRKPRLDPAIAEFARLFDGHLVDGTRPAGQGRRPWTTDEFAGAIKLPKGLSDGRKGADRTDDWSAKSIGNWRTGANLPSAIAIEPILATLFGPNPSDGRAGRKALRKAYNDAVSAKSRRDLRQGLEPIGHTVVVTADQLAFQDSPAPDDVAAAASPDVLAEHPLLVGHARTLVRMVKGRHNALSPGWEDLLPTAQRFQTAIECPASELPPRIVAIYQLCLSLATLYEQDDSYRTAPEPGERRLPADLLRRLGELVTFAAQMLHAFPYVQRKDGHLRRFMRPQDGPATRDIAATLQRSELLSDESVLMLKEDQAVAQRPGGQAAKATEQLFATITNVLLEGTAAALDPDTSALLRQRLHGVYRDAKDPIGILVVGMAPTVRAALRHGIEQAAEPDDLRAALRDVLAQNQTQPRGEDALDVPVLPTPAIVGLPPQQLTPIRQPEWEDDDWYDKVGGEWPPRIPLTRWQDTIPDLQVYRCPEMITLPAGRFTMGAPRDEEGSEDDERPQREVTVPLFALGRCAVTFAQWDAAREAGADLPRPRDRWRRGDQPVINVSWGNAQAYCAWLNARLGLSRRHGYRLPTEAEWEYACRAGTITPFSFGATVSINQANYDGTKVYVGGRKGEFRERTVPVGTLPPNVWGLHEMHGNVLEWVQDALGSYADAPLDGSIAVTGEGKGLSRVLRGGSWTYPPQSCRAAFRDGISPGLSLDFVGFRLARTPGP